VNYDGHSSNSADTVLGRFAKIVVSLTFLLIFIGGHTTTSGAGMAFPDWPLSHGSLNPNGWWSDMMMRLEHGHRWTAGPTGLLIGILCAWVWQSKWAVPVALGVAVLVGSLVKFAGGAMVAVALSGIASSAIAFAVMLFAAQRRDLEPRAASVRWTAFAAFVGVCAQAVLGGLRVILDPQGIAATTTSTATTFRIIHGCFAQMELCLVVALAVMLSPVWRSLGSRLQLRSVARLGWVASSFVVLQLIVGATMRHLGAGLAIPTWPQANPDGRWLPAMHNAYVDLNFTHTRFGAIIVTVMIVALAVRAMRNAGGDLRIVRPAILLLGLVSAQFTLGLFVIWHGRPAIITTLHVVNGAALLATTLLLTLRAGRASVQGNRPGFPAKVGELVEAAV
jgi:cytochrome c oxidase assembly protein subunit 15